MNLNQFFQIFYKEFGGSDTIPEYFTKLVDCFIRLPSNNEERALEAKDEFNPVQKTPTAIYTWINKSGKAARNMNPKIAKAIYDLGDIDKFKDHFEKVATHQQCEKVRDGLRKFHFDATDDNCFDVSGKLLSKIFEFRARRKNDVKPRDIEEYPFVQDSDIVFLQEVGNKCPLCSRKLITTKNGKKLPQYRIVSIYPRVVESKDADKFNAIKKAPKDKGADENMIPLCLNCANAYDIAPTVDDYEKLAKIKEQALNTYKLDQNLQNTSLEQQIADVVKKISQLNDEDVQGNKAEMNPVAVKEKIPNSLMLQLKVTNMVQLFYNIINRQLVHLSEASGLDLDIVVQQFSIAYKKISKYRNTREEQFQSMVTWLQQGLNLSDSYKTACEFVVAFFVQNCEVFEKVETTK